MRSFVFYLPTVVHFGVGLFARVGEMTAQIGKRPLLVTGRSSLRKSGRLDQVLEQLKQTGVEPVLFERIEPNPRSTTCDEGAALAVSEGCDCILAIGGGLSMDASKAIATVAAQGGKTWDYVLKGDGRTTAVREALPIVAVPTVAATCSESDSGAVISNPDTNEKSVMGGRATFPRVAIVDPELTVTLSRQTTADGAIDIISHVLDPYLTESGRAPLSDGFGEAIMRTVMDALPRALADGSDMQAREDLSWCSSVALNGLPNAGRTATFPMHNMQHSLSAHYPELAHGRGLCALFPAWMAVVAERNPAPAARLARGLFGFDEEASDSEAAGVAVEKMTAYLKEHELHTRLSDVGIGSDKFSQMATDTVRIYGRDGVLPGPPPMSAEQIVEVYEACA
jgi:alcohol dehydrogenase YqhD (iron-dependent ADH family)